MDGLEAGQFLGEDGAFQANWRDEAFPGDENKEVRENPTLANIKDVRSMARQVISGESTIGKLSGGRDFAILPNENSTPEEIETFQTKVGRPKSAAEYGLAEVENADPKFAEKMSNAFHAAGSSKGAVGTILKAYNEYATEYAAAQETEDKISDAKADKEIRGKLGSTYDASHTNVNLAIDALAAPISAEFAAELKKDIPYDVNGFQLFSKIGELIAEDPGLKEATKQTGFTPSDARAKANEVMQDPYYISEEPKDKPRNKSKHDALVQQVADLLTMANG